MKQTFLRLEIEEVHMLKPREAVMIIALTPSGEFFLDCFVAEGKLLVDFLQATLEGFETPAEGALRLLGNNALGMRELEFLTLIYPKGGSIDRIHVFTARGVQNLGNRALVVCDLKTLLDYMEVHVFASEEGKQALLQFIR